MTDDQMQIKSDGRCQGVIYRGVRYVRFSYLDPEINEEVAYWWVRDPLDVMTRIRDLEVIMLLNSSYAKLNHGN